MAVHNGENQTSQAPRNERREEARQEAPRQDRAERQAQPQRRGGSLRDLNRLLGAPLSRNMGGEALVNAIKAFRDWTNPEQNVGGSGDIDLSKLQILGMEASEHNVLASAVIFAYPVEVEGRLNVYTYTCVLEGTVDGDLPLRNYDFARRQYAVPTVVGDYVTDGFLKNAADIASKAFSDQRRTVNTIDAGWRVVSRRVDFSLEKNPQVHALAFYALAALTALVNADSNDELYFDLDWLAKGESLDINIDVSGREVVSADGLPRRTDFQATIQGSIQSEDNNTTRARLSTVGGRIDLVYAPDAETERGFGGRRQRENTQIYTAVAILNTMDTGINAITPELLFLGLAGASVISRHNNWAQVFLPNDVRGKTDYRDTGYLALLSSAKEVVSIGNRTNLDTDEWAEYFFSLVREELAWGIEVEEGGDNSWITSLLYAAATGDRDAEERLWEYADRLTAGNFSARARELNVNKFVTLSGARYLTGTYVDDAGELRDLRDFDNLRWLVQTGKEDPNITLDWQETFDNLDKEPEIRVAEQHAMLQSLLQNNISYARYVNLLYFNPDAIKALALAVDDCGVGIDQSNVMYGFGNRRVRGNSRITAFAGGDVSGGIFNRTREVGGNRRSSRAPLGNGMGRRNF